MAIEVTTDQLRHLSGPELCAAWEELVSSHVLGQDIEYRRPAGRLFGSIRTAGLAGLLLARLYCSSSQEVSRSRRRIAQEKEESALLCLQVTGQGLLLSEGETRLLRPGDWAVCDCLRPYSWKFDDCHGQLVLRLPRERLLGRLNLPELAHGSVFSGASGSGRIAWDFINSMWDELSFHDAELNPRFEDITIELVAAALNERPGRAARVTRGEAARLIEIKAYINERLSDPGLYVDSIADALGLSARYLHLVFAGEDCSVSRYIRERRLERCAADLADPNFRQRGVTEIAHSWGFGSHGAFCRRFRERYGVSPREFRQLSLR